MPGAPPAKTPEKRARHWSCNTQPERSHTQVLDLKGKAPHISAYEFGMASPIGSPDERDVLEHAVKILAAVAPDVRVQRESLRLRLAVEDRELVWNLHDFIRQAPGNSAWRVELDDLARQVAKAILLPTESREATGLLQVRLRPADRMPEVFADSAVEEVFPGVVALYGRHVPCMGGLHPGIHIATWDEVDALASRERARELAALVTLGPDFSLGDLVTPMMDDVPVYTNGAFHPHIAVALLVPIMWRKICAAFDPEPRTLLAVAPAPSRIIFTTMDDPEFIPMLHALAEHATEIEEELLTLQVLRFDGTSWRALDSRH